MRYGRLRHKMSLETPESTNERGIPTTTWYPDGSIFADVSPLSGRELITAQAVQSDVGCSDPLSIFGSNGP